MRTTDLIACVIKEQTGITVIDYDVHLLSKRTGIPIENFLYVVAVLEDKYFLQISKLLENNDYTIFTINNLANALDSLASCK